jgi:high-affinity Fe2+/Pb2+ permease
VDRALKAVAHPYQRRKPTNEKLRALGWTIALVLGVATAFVGSVALVVIGGALAVSVVGGPAGVILTLVTACLLIAVGIWLANDKQRP